MARILRVFLLVTAFSTISLPSVAEKTPGVWKYQDFHDDFDGAIKRSVAHAFTSTQFGLEDVYIIVREKLGEIDAYIITGDSYICKEGLSWEMKVNFIVDGEKLSTTMIVSDNHTALFFSKRATPFWIAKLNEGKSLKMRYRDGCSETTTLEFDIQGHTRFGGT